MKKISFVFVLVIIILTVCSCGDESAKTRDVRSDDSVSLKDYENLQEQLQVAQKAEKKRTDEKEALEKELAMAKDELQELASSKEELQRTQGLLDAAQEDLQAVQEDLQAARKLYEDEKNEYAAYKEKMSAYENLSQKELEAREAEARMTIEKEKEEQQRKEKEAEEARKKEEEERKKAEEKAQKEAEEKEKKGYNTGITYDQLARTPDKYIDEKVKFTGEIVQILEGDDYNEMRLSVHKNSSGWYDSDQIIYCAYIPSIIDYRLLEGDIITIYGVSKGIYSYESVMHTTITLPLVIIDKLERKK